MCNVTALRSGLQPIIDRPLFVLWKLEQRFNTKTNSWDDTKVPYRTNGYGASSTDPSHWSDFETAAMVYNCGGYDGIGLMMPDDGSLFFLDCDNALQADNTWQQYVNEFYGMFGGAFFEVSQSGRGAHFIGYGRKPENFGSKSKDKNVANFDYYSRMRFCALTGNSVRPMQFLDYSAQLASICEKYIGVPVDTSKIEWDDVTPSDYTFKGTDEELLAHALKSTSVMARFGSAASFKDIWNRNDDVLAKHFPGDSGPVDESKLESALCTHLAFWCGNNAARIERIVSAWPHCRDKWLERSDYRRGTITKAIAVNGPDSYFSKRDPAVTAMLEMPKTDLLAVPTTAPNWTNGVSFGAEYSKDHSASASQFLTDWYDQGRHLIRIDQDFFRFNGKVWEQTDEDTIKAELTMAMRASSPQDSWINGAYSIIKHMSHKPVSKWGTWLTRDTNNVIVYQNGILDLTLNEFVSHDPNYFTTNIMPYDYDENASCTNWTTFLNEVFEGDQERIELLQEWFGYMLVRDYSFHKMMLLLGLGRSGKGTIGAILEKLVGDQNFAGIGLEDLAGDENLNALRQKTVAFDGDSHGVSQQNAKLVLTRAKKISGNDAVNFSRKFKSSVSQRLPTRITVAANNGISFIDDSGAMANRFLILVFNKSWLGREDTTLLSRLSGELSGIANWAIVGLHRLRMNNRFTAPEACQAEHEAMHEAYSPLKQFAEDHLEFGVENRVTSQAVYQAYTLWCRNQGRNAGTQNKLTRNLIDTFRGQGVVKAALAEGRGFRGVGLKQFKVVSNG